MMNYLGGVGTESLRSKTRRALFSLCVGAATLFGAGGAQAATHHGLRHFAYRHRHDEYAAEHHRYDEHHEYAADRHLYRHGDAWRYDEVRDGVRYEHAGYRLHYLRYTTHYRHSGLQCVPYAREVSHIDLSGNAFLWWAEAAGRYARGTAPAEGAVLDFRGIGRMPLGHVAVVTSVINNRTILVTQANWVRGTITNDVTMQDVSPNNDWTQVQVELGDSSTWGAAYPTYGFIYNQPAGNTVIAASGQGNEVAEAPAATPVSLEAPDRNLQ
jgi:hypothetical protein